MKNVKTFPSIPFNNVGLKIYEPGNLLAKNQFLLAVLENGFKKSISQNFKQIGNQYIDKGFLTKLTQKNTVPVSFSNWITWGRTQSLPIYVFEEELRSGWELAGIRIGQSQQWAVMKHPMDFTVEIYLDNLEEIILNHTMVNGVIQGEFRWEGHKLHNTPIIF